MNYISTLIVDDDRILLDDLIHTINWEAQGFRIVATASNGIQALKLYHQFHPQFIITDIVMPVMDGIELLKEIRKQDNSAYILMLSSYDDFNYAKESINHHANNYVLKDEINAEVLADKLNQAKKVIFSNARQADTENQTVIYRFFSEEERDVFPVPENPACSFLFQEKFCFFLLELATPVFSLPILNESADRPAGRQTEIRSGSMSAILSEIQNTAFPGTSFDTAFSDASFDTAFSDASFYTAAPVSRRHILILIKWLPENSLTKKQQTITLSLNELCRQLYRKFQTASACFYSTLPQTLAEFRDLYRQHHFPDRYFAHGTDRDLIENIHSLKQATHISPKEITLFDSPSDLNNPQLVRDTLGQFIRQYGNTHQFYGQEEILLQLFHLLDRAWYSGKNERIVPPVLYTYKEFADWFQGICEKLTYLKSDSQNALSLPVKLTIENINQEYQNPNLSVTMLANKVYLSTSYLSTLFKSETGKSINEFITGVRIAKAKSLLQNPKLKIYEISSLTGYSSSQYFSQSFLKATGMMPKQYRRNLQK